MDINTIKQVLSYALAEDIHETWRSFRKKEDGTYEPRIKESKDNNWNIKHQTNIVDIANSSFDELPENWQYENLEAAKVAIDLVYDKTIAFEPITFDELEQMAAIIHNEWLKRNSWVIDPKLTVPYNKLSKEEQKKDKIQIIAAQTKIMEYIKGLIDIEELGEKYNVHIPHKHLSKEK